MLQRQDRSRANHTTQPRQGQLKKRGISRPESEAHRKRRQASPRNSTTERDCPAEGSSLVMGHLHTSSKRNHNPKNTPTYAGLSCAVQLRGTVPGHPPRLVANEPVTGVVHNPARTGRTGQSPSGAEVCSRDHLSQLSHCATNRYK